MYIPQKVMIYLWYLLLRTVLSVYPKTENLHRYGKSLQQYLILRNYKKHKLTISYKRQFLDLLIFVVFFKFGTELEPSS